MALASFLGQGQRNIKLRPRKQAHRHLTRTEIQLLLFKTTCAVDHISFGTKGHQFKVRITCSATRMSMAHNIFRNCNTTSIMQYLCQMHKFFFLPTKKSDPSCIWWFQKWGPLLVPKNGLQKLGYPLCLDKWSFLHYRNYTKIDCQPIIAALQLRSLPCRDLDVSYWLHYMGCTTALLRASCGPCSCRDLDDSYWLHAMLNSLCQAATLVLQSNGNNNGIMSITII